MIFSDYSAFKSSGFHPKVCIIGSGPAGISLALQLEKNKIPSIIIEAGGLNYSPTSQEIYRGKVIGDTYFTLDYARLRYFGGSSGHWMGWCRPLDDIDFEPRKKYPHSGWPIRKKDLEPYAKQTDTILELGVIQADNLLDQNLKEVFFVLASLPLDLAKNIESIFKNPH
jgi:choline dehydrogenase-like flavoprotein